MPQEGTDARRRRIELDPIDLDMPIGFVMARAQWRARRGWRHLGLATTSDSGVHYEVWEQLPEEKPEGGELAS